MDKKIPLPTVLISMILILTSCYYGTPPGNVGFENINYLNSIAGRYRNLGETGALTGKIYLSELIWGYAPNFDQNKIKEIEVIVKNEREIEVKAYSDENQVIKKGNYVKGKDFNIVNGRIEIVREESKEGNVIVGPYYSNTELGLDKKGNAKYRIEGAVIGLAYLVMPVAAASREDIRFVRVDNSKNR